jgi:hypothetical protein
MADGYIGSAHPYLDGEREMELHLTAKFQYHEGSGFCYHFQDPEGRCVVWFSKRKQNLAVGSTIRATFVIYKHSEFNGSKQNRQQYSWLTSRRIPVLASMPDQPKPEIAKEEHTENTAESIGDASAHEGSDDLGDVEDGYKQQNAADYEFHHRYDFFHAAMLSVDRDWRKGNHH